MESTFPSAEVMASDDIEDLVDGLEIYIPAVIIGERVNGDIYFVSHTCPRCHAKMTTGGVGYMRLYCGECWANRGVRVEMTRKFERLEDE